MRFILSGAAALLLFSGEILAADPCVTDPTRGPAVGFSLEGESCIVARGSGDVIPFVRGGREYVLLFDGARGAKLRHPLGELEGELYPCKGTEASYIRWRPVPGATDLNRDAMKVCKMAKRRTVIPLPAKGSERAAGGGR